MTSSGIQRKVDDLGRIVIPAGIRRSLGIREGDPLDVSVDGEAVVLSKPTDRCVFCGATDDLRRFRSRRVCADCVGALNDAPAREAEAPKEQPAPAAEPHRPWTPPLRPAAPAPAIVPERVAAPVAPLRYERPASSSTAW